MSQKRQELIDTAIRLFAQNGFHNTGIDWIAEEAQVSKKTMYHHFRSKEELILAALKHHDGLFRNFFMKSVNQVSESPYERLLGIFDVAHAWFSDHEFYGCMFINAIGEYSHRDTPIRKACQDFKAQMAGYVEELAISADIDNPSALANTLALLLEGSIVTAQVAGKPDSANTAKLAAKVLIDNAVQARDEAV
ncbi:MAG: TetR/AcrR family transcriptional regulator [Pseudomonadales bacterium]